jgi:hypothetical protein
MFPNWETQFINASATALFAGGWETDELTHARKQMKPAYDWAIRNLMFARVEGNE